MNKESFKEIVLEILFSNSDETFYLFLKKLSEYLSGNKTLKLDGFGYFQVKREPLSRMERKGEENEKEILIFLPEDETFEEKILSFEINNESNSENNQNDSVFNIGINRPTVISDNEDIENDEVNIESRILEFIESGEILENYDLLTKVPFSSLNTENEKTAEESIIDNNIDLNTDEIFVDQNLESVEDGNAITEVKINKDFLIDDDSELDDSGAALELNDLEELDDFEKDNNDFSKKSNSFDIKNNYGFTKVDDNDESETNLEEKNPFDELENYIKEDNLDEAQEIIDEVPDEVGEVNISEKAKTIELNTKSKNTNKHESYSSLRKKKISLFKNPIFYIAFSIGLIAIIVILFVLPNSETKLNESDETKELNSQNNSNIGIIDSTEKIDSTNFSNDKRITSKQSANEKLAEIKDLEKNKTIPVQGKKLQKVETKPTNNLGLYREIPNDKSITDRIYFNDGKYTVQASSWKSASIAEREVQKLKKRGFDAFIVKVFLKSKGSTWNRVRIGYFNSKLEAEEFLRKNKI